MGQYDRLNGLVGNLGVKAPCNCATLGPITLSGSQTIDGYPCTPTDNDKRGTRVLVKDQVDPITNGIYYCNEGAWERAPDFDGDGDAAQGTRVFISSGTANGNTEWVVTTANPIRIGTSALAFAAYVTLAGVMASNIHNATEKTSLANADEFGFWDSVTQTFKKITWANVLSMLSGAYQALSGRDASGGYAGLTLFKINFKNVANTFTSFFTNTNTAARTYTFQDKDGTIADLADVANAVTTAPEKIPSIGCTQAGGALTFSVTSQYLDFRSATATSGAVSTVFAAPANLVLPSGGTLGFPSGIGDRILVAEVNNAGVAELAIRAIRGGADVSETGVISTTAISAASTSASVWYSTTARANVAYRLLGAVDAVNTAGAWGSPTFIQGAGGNARFNMHPQSMIRLSGANGYGSTNTAIRRFSTVQASLGNDITYTDSATLGASFTINTPGTYSFSYNDNATSAFDLGWSLNSTQLTTNIYLINASDRLAASTTNASWASGPPASVTVFLPAGSVVRPHLAPGLTSFMAANAQCTVTRVD